MEYQNLEIAKVAKELKAQLSSLNDKTQILKSDEFKSLMSKIKLVPPDQRKSFGEEVNKLKNELQDVINQSIFEEDTRATIDITAPFSPNTSLTNRPKLLSYSQGTQHPLTKELNKIIDIYYRMGFSVVESRQIDDDYHMFESLNFPSNHPARDDYDTFMTAEGFIAPAHTSTMQNRVMRMYKDRLSNGEAIAVVMPGRVFRNEDLDATHEHTFYQLEGVYVDKQINVGNLISVLKSFMNEYFGQELKFKLQPFYFPFTEPSFEFAIQRPESLKRGNSEADQWLELLGCGMIHPKVLNEAGIDPEEYSGFAWGGGIERLVLMKNNIEDIRYFESGKLDFLRQFK